MAFKLVIKALEEVAEGLRGEYTAGPDGRYYAKVEALDDHPDVGALRRAKERETQARRDAEAKNKELSAKLDELEAADTERLKGMVKKEDVETLEKKYKTATEKLETEHQAAIRIRDESIQNLTVEAEATRLAASLAVDEASIPVFMPHIRSRMGVAWEDGKPTLKILGEDGKPTDLTIEKLKAEFVANPAFGPIIKGSEASGGGAKGGSGSGGADPQSNADLAAVEPKDLAARIAKKKAKK